MIKKEIETSQIASLQQMFEATPYKDLKEAFTKFGVGKVWKAGVNKENLIKLAISALDADGLLEKAISINEGVILDKLDEKVNPIEKVEPIVPPAPLEEEEIEEEEEIIDPIKISNTKTLVIEDEEEEQVEEVEEKQVEKLIDPNILSKLTEAEIEENLRLIVANLRQANDSTKRILLIKQKELLDHLDGLSNTVD